MLKLVRFEASRHALDAVDEVALQVSRFTRHMQVRSFAPDLDEQHRDLASGEVGP